MRTFIVGAAVAAISMVSASASCPAAALIAELEASPAATPNAKCFQAATVTSPTFAASGLSITGGFTPPVAVSVSAVTVAVSNQLCAAQAANTTGLSTLGITTCAGLGYYSSIGLQQKAAGCAYLPAVAGVPACTIYNSTNVLAANATVQAGIAQLQYLAASKQLPVCLAVRAALTGLRACLNSTCATTIQTQCAAVNLATFNPNTATLTLGTVSAGLLFVESIVCTDFSGFANGQQNPIGAPLALNSTTTVGSASCTTLFAAGQTSGASLLKAGVVAVASLLGGALAF